jgi:Bacterial SH3 domain./Tetratricopeptide repeat.
MKEMKKVIYIWVLALVSFTIHAQDVLEQANTAYTAGEFETALELYQQEVTAKGESATLYYNIGNCYYRLNEVAPSILFYERSLLLDPGNKDARFNLEIAKLKTVDRIEPIDEFFLTGWFRSVRNLMSTDEWSYFSIACFILLIVGAFFFFFSRKIILKKIGFFSGLMFLVFVIFGNIFANQLEKELTNRNTAILFSPTITIKSSPDNSGTDLFILHEGTKVEIKSTLGDWNEIETADGNVGWIRSSEIEVI